MRLNAEEALVKKRPTNIYLTPMLRDGVKAILQARKDRGEDVKQNQIFEEAVAQYVEARDLRTGLLKPPPTQVSFPSVTAWVNCDQEDDALFEALEDTSRMIWVAAPNNDCLYVTRALAEYAGRTAEEFRHMGWAEVLHPEDREKTFEKFRVGFHTRQPLRTVYRVRREDGLYGSIVDEAAPRLRHGRFAGYVGTMYQVASEAHSSDPPESVIPTPKPVILHMGAGSSLRRAINYDLLIVESKDAG